MRHLDLYDVLAVAARVLQCDSDIALRRTNLDAVDDVLTEARRTAGVSEAAAALLSGLVRARPFEGPNRVIAVAVVLQFAALNDAELTLEPVEELDELLDRIDRVSPGEVLRFVTGRLDTGSRLNDLFRAGSWLEDEVALVLRDDEIFQRGVGMLERFSEPARQVVALAQEEARGLSHGFIGTEHLLLGLIREGHSGAAKTLAGAGVTAPGVRDLVVEIIGRGAQDSGGAAIPFTPRAKTALERGYDESRALGAEQIGPEHLLLGLIRDGEGVAGQVLVKLGADLDDLRKKMIDWVEHRQHVESAVAGFLADTKGERSGWTTPARHRFLLAELGRVFDDNDRLHEDVHRLAEDNERLQQEVIRLRELLHGHDIDPDR